MGLDVTAGTGTSGIVLQEDPNNPARINYQLSSAGQGSIGVEQLNATSQVIITGDNGGSEQAILGRKGLINSVLGNVEVEGNTGTVSLLVNDSQDTVPHTFAITTDGQNLVFNEDGVQIALVSQPVTAFTLDTGPATNTVNLGLEITAPTSFTATLQSGGTNDNINVQSLESPSILNLIGGAGVDNVTLKADQVEGPVHISNTTGLEAVTIDGSNATIPQVISVTDSLVTAFGTGSYSLANLKSLSLIGGDAFDNFTVTPSATIPMTFDGGPTSGASPDRLAITTTNVTGTTLSLQPDATGEAGTYTFTNRQPITFTAFGTISPDIGDLTGTVYNEQSGAPVPGAMVVIDPNNNGVIDPGEITTTNATGDYSFQCLPAGQFPIFATAPGRKIYSPSLPPSPPASWQPLC